jgi:hypothetical protein
VSFEHFHYVLRNQIDGFVETRRKLLYEILHQQRDVLDPFAERREADRDNVEPVIEIGAKEAKFHPPYANSLGASDGDSLYPGAS